MMDFRSLVKAGIHFGHRTSVWCPKMAPYIWGYKNNVHLIDVSKTAYYLEKAAQFLENVAAEGKTILWVGTKKSAQNAIFEAAKRLNQPYVNHRWIGGTLSNYTQVKKSVTKLLHYEDILSRSSSFPYYTKKELNTFSKIVDRLKKNIGGIVNVKWPIGAVVLIDVRKEQSALKEAHTMGIPVVALVDTNSDPSLVDYVIPGNDDAPRAVKIIVDYLAEAVVRGQEAATTRTVEVKEEEKLLEEEKVMPDEESEEDEETVAGIRLKKGAAEERKKKVVKKESLEEETLESNEGSGKKKIMRSTSSSKARTR